MPKAVAPTVPQCCLNATFPVANPRFQSPALEPRSSSPSWMYPIAARLARHKRRTMHELAALCCRHRTSTSGTTKRLPATPVREPNAYAHCSRPAQRSPRSSGRRRRMIFLSAAVIHRSALPRSRPPRIRPRAVPLWSLRPVDMPQRSSEHPSASIEQLDDTFPPLSLRRRWCHL